MDTTRVSYALILGLFLKNLLTYICNFALIKAL